MGIEFDTAPKDLDVYLKKAYSFGLLDFTESICFIYQDYKIKDIKSFLSSSQKRIQDLEKAKSTLGKNMDNFDDNPISGDIDALIERKKRYVEFAQTQYSFLKTGDKIDATYLLILAWALALKQKGHVSWIEIISLYSWFSIRFEGTVLEEIFKHSDDIPFPQDLKSKLGKYLNKKFHNQYKYFKYYKLALYIFKNCFWGDKRVRELPEPFNIEFELLRYSRFGVHIGDVDKFNKDLKLYNK